MALTIRNWDDITEDELRAEGNTTVVVGHRDWAPGLQGASPRQYVEDVEYLAFGWAENPQTGTLSLRRRVRIAEIDEILIVEFAQFNKDEWAWVRNSAFVYDADGMLLQKQQREEAEQAQREAMAAQALGVGPNRAARRQVRGIPQ